MGKIIDSKDLMIGNIMRNEMGRVIEVGIIATTTTLQGVSLNESILIKMGFVYRKGHLSTISKTPHYQYGRIVVHFKHYPETFFQISLIGEYGGMSAQRRVEYVHELQNYYKIVTGADLPVSLEIFKPTPEPMKLSDIICDELGMIKNPLIGRKDGFAKKAVKTASGLELQQIQKRAWWLDRIILRLIDDCPAYISLKGGYAFVKKKGMLFVFDDKTTIWIKNTEIEAVKAMLNRFS